MDRLPTLVTGGIGRKIVVLDVVDSTNTFAMGLTGGESAHGTVVIAERQTKGRGRMGREWISQPGLDITMSVILKPSIMVSDVTLLTVLVSVACCIALRETTGLRVTLKWPNDLMVNGKKMGGILTEIRAAADKVTAVVIGIGINLNSLGNDLPPEVRTRATSAKSETGREYERTPVIAAICDGLDSWYETLLREGSGRLLDAWRNLSSMLGGFVTVISGKETLRGIAKDIDDRGMLLLELPSGAVKKLSSGEVTTSGEEGNAK